MKVLVTGSSGFIGGHLVRRLAVDHEVVALQRRPPADRVPGVDYLVLDLLHVQPDRLPSGIEAVVHEAAHLDDPFGVEPGIPALAPTNVLGTLYLADAAAVLGVRRFVYGSTGGVTGAGAPGATIVEDEQPRPDNHYGLTKYLAEQALFRYRWPFEVVALRYYYPYGRNGSNPLFRHLTDCLIAEQEIAVGSDGGPLMNPVHIDDAVEITRRALEADGLTGALNVAGPDRVTEVHVAELLGTALGYAPRFRFGPEPAPSHLADTTRLHAYLGRATVSVEEGIGREFGDVNQ